jgi:hypothetical protein
MNELITPLEAVNLDNLWDVVAKMTTTAMQSARMTTPRAIRVQPVGVGSLLLQEPLQEPWVSAPGPDAGLHATTKTTGMAAVYQGKTKQPFAESARATLTLPKSGSGKRRARRQQRRQARRTVPLQLRG